MNPAVPVRFPRTLWNPSESTKTVLVLVFYIVATGVMLFPFSVNLSNHVPDLGDPLEHVWRVTWAGQALISDPSQLYQTNILFPYPNTLAFSESQLTTVISELPLYLATGNPILAFNLVFLASFALTGFTTYLLAYDLTRSRGGALLAGFAFAFWGYRFNHLSHIPLMTVQWLPLVMFALRRSLYQDRRVFPILFAVAFVAQVLSSWYSALVLVLLVSLYFLYAMVFRPNARNVRRLATLAVCFGIALVPVFAVGLPYYQVSRELQFARTLGEAGQISARPLSFLSPAHFSVLYQNILPEASGDALFAGALILVLAVFGLRRKFPFPDRPYWIFAILFFGILAFGPVISLGSNIEFPSPLYRLLHEYMPGFQATRAPSRFFVGGMLGLCLLAANGFGSLTKRMGYRVRLALTAAALLILSIEYLTVPLYNSPIETGADVPPVYTWLQTQPPGNIVELPTAVGDVLPITRAMYYSLYHRRAMPIGYASFIPPTQVDFLNALNTALETPSPRVPNLLREFDVRYVVVNRTAENAAAVENALDQAPSLESVFEDATQRVYRVDAEAPAHPLKLGCLAPAYAQPNAPFTLYLTAAHERRYPIVNQELAPLTVSIRWQQGDTTRATQAQTVRLPYVIPERETGVPVTVNAPAESGDYTLTCTLENAEQLDKTAKVQVSPNSLDSSYSPGLELLALQVNADNPREAGQVIATFAWRKQAEFSKRIAMHVQLVGSDGTVVSEWLREPVLYMYPVRLWRDNELVSDSYALPVPADAPAGEYRVVISAIDQDTNLPIPFRHPQGASTTEFSSDPFLIP